MDFPVEATNIALGATEAIKHAAQIVGSKLMDETAARVAVSGGDEVVVQGRRLIDRLLRRHQTTSGADPDRDELRNLLQRLADLPQDPARVMSVELMIQRLIENDAHLARDLTQTLTTNQTVNSGTRRASVGGDNHGIVISGDRNRIDRQ